jgi:hypothetical protein
LAPQDGSCICFVWLLYLFVCMQEGIYRSLCSLFFIIVVVSLLVCFIAFSSAGWHLHR